jgi:glyoxylase-like metal-dependent hydrolase (beta-lactamase superfamily II)
MGLLVCLAVGVVTAACTRATPEQQIVNDAAAALGGRDQILAASTLIIEGEGEQHNLGQELSPSASDQRFVVSKFRRALDLAGGRTRTELTRQPNFMFFQGPAAQTQVQGIDGDVGYNVAPNGNATRIGVAPAADRRAEYYHHPLTAVRAALDPMAALANPRTEGSESLLDVTAADGTRFTLAIDATSHLPTRVVSMAYNANLGDVTLSTAFADYQNAGGLQLPTSLTSRTDTFTTAAFRVSNTVGGDTGDLAAPAAAASATAAPAGPPPVTVAEEVIAPGIWYLAGGSHHSVLVEFADHLTLIETPQNEARALAVIAKARELVPGKPLTQVVNSHYHFDHSGGLRAAVSEGLTVITHEGNAAFYREAMARPHTIVPDALAKNPRPLTIETVGAEGRELTDGRMRINLFPIVSGHNEAMLGAYFPAQRLLVAADVYTPGGATFVYAGKFLEDLKARNLRIDRMVPLHGKVVPFAQFVKDASATPAATN